LIYPSKDHLYVSVNNNGFANANAQVIRRFKGLHIFFWLRSNTWRDQKYDLERKDGLWHIKFCANPKSHGFIIQKAHS